MGVRIWVLVFKVRDERKKDGFNRRLEMVTSRKNVVWQKMRST